MESRIRDPVAGRIAAVTTTTTIETRKQRSSHTWSVGAIAFNIIYSSPRVLLRGHRLVAWWSALKVHILYCIPLLVGYWPLLPQCRTSILVSLIGQRHGMRIAPGEELFRVKELGWRGMMEM